MKFHSIFIGFIALLLTSCGTANVRKDFSAESLEDSGLIIGSLTQKRSKRGHQGFSADISGLSIFYKNLDTGKTSVIKTDPWLLGSLSKGDFKNVEGRGTLFVIELEAGQYEISGWHAMQGAYTSVSSKNPKSFVFNVEAGDVIYIGELETRIIYGKNLLGIGVMAGAEQFVVDSESRDIQALEQKYPNIDTKQITKRLLVEAGEPASESIRKSTNYVPPPIVQ